MQYLLLEQIKAGEVPAQMIEVRGKSSCVLDGALSFENEWNSIRAINVTFQLPPNLR